MFVLNTLKKIIVPLTKSPHPQGRFGPTKKQDWYQALLKSVFLARKFDLPILMISDVHVLGQEHEMLYYREALRDLGFNRAPTVSNIKKRSFFELWQGQETVEQVEIALAFCKEKNLEPVFVSTFLHYPRVVWLIRRTGFKSLFSMKGAPRFKEALTDIVLDILFPFIDLCGGRRKFQNWVYSRRIRGKH